MERQHERPPHDPLSVLRSVESAPPGDLDWALHCTRQQAVIVSVLLPRGREAALADVSEAIGITVEPVDDLPVPSTSFLTADGWQIHVNAALPRDEQLRAALHGLKHVIDHPIRRRADKTGFTHAEHEHLADAFAEMVLGGIGDEPTPERRESP